MARPRRERCWLRAQWIQDPAARTIRIACWPRLWPRRMRRNRDRAGAIRRNRFRRRRRGWEMWRRCGCADLYFSEKLDNPDDPTSAVEFYLTVEGQEPKMFDMNADEPNIVVQQGTVEDWIIENRSSELHDFHIHQLHFLLLDYMGKPVHEDFFATR